MKNVEGGFDGGECVGLFLASRRVGTRRSLIVFARFYVEAGTSERFLIFQQPIVRVILFILFQPSWWLGSFPPMYPPSIGAIRSQFRSEIRTRLSSTW